MSYISVEFITKDGVTLRGRFFKATQQKSVVLVVHGFQGHSAWPHGGEWLAEHGISSLSFDRRGTGQSEGARGHVANYQQYLLDIEAARTELIRQSHIVEFKEKISILSSSLGTLLSCHYSLKHPDHVEHLIFINPGLFPSKNITYSLWNKIKIITGPKEKQFNAPLQDSYFTEDPKWIEWLKEDELSTRKISAGFLKEIRRAKSDLMKNLKALKTPPSLYLFYPPR
jgi:alpha-beta hydrolase superfamily lysophospholipase